MRKLKLASLTLSIITSLHVNAEVMSQKQLDDLFVDSLVTPTALVNAFSQHTFTDNIELFLSQVIALRPNDLSEILTLLYSTYPDRVEELTAMALSLGVTSEEVTIAAINAGIDPTVVAEATAAGIVEPSLVPNAPTKKEPVSVN